MRAPRLTFLGGVNEIGGNKIVVEDGPDRVLFDFGPSFSPQYDAFWFNFLQPRSTSPVKDRLEFDLLPRVAGLYSEDALYGTDLAYQPPEFHAMFVSHAHFDHAGSLNLIDPKIPVYLGATTRELLRAVETTTQQRYGVHDYRPAAEGRPIRVGRIEVVPLPVDHSIPGAYGYLIRTSEGVVAYTGDFRMHGPRAKSTHAFIEAAGAEHPDTLVIEGTRAGPDPRKNLSEEGVRLAVDRLLSQTEEIALVSCYPRDLDRLVTLYAAARTAGRTFAVSFKTAHLLKSLRAELGPSVPAPGESEGLVAYRRAKRQYYKWERPFLDDAVDAEWVRRHGREILLSLDLAHFAELIDLRPPRGAAFIHSMSEPFSEDDVDEQVLANWLDHFGLHREQMHASGHCSGPELGQVAEGVQGKRLIPVHTEHAEAFRALAPRVTLPEKGEPIEIGR